MRWASPSGLRWDGARVDSEAEAPPAREPDGQRPALRQLRRGGHLFQAQAAPENAGQFRHPGARELAQPVSAPAAHREASAVVLAVQPGPVRSRDGSHAQRGTAPAGPQRVPEPRPGRGGAMKSTWGTRVRLAGGHLAHWAGGDQGGTTYLAHGDYAWTGRLRPVAEDAPECGRCTRNLPELEDMVKRMARRPASASAPRVT